MEERRLTPGREDGAFRCLGCAAFFEKCPDFDAYNCPACGEKVMPEPMFQKRFVHVERAASCDAEAWRADGRVLCTCGKAYKDHPQCFATRSRWSSAGPYLNVLCDGTHVKL